MLHEPSEAAIEAAAQQLPGEVRGNVITALEAAYAIDGVRGAACTKEDVALWLLSTEEGRAMRAALRGPDPAPPAGPWEAREVPQGWVLARPDMGAVFVSRTGRDFTEAEAIAVRDALNRVVARSAAEDRSPRSRSETP